MFVRCIGTGSSGNSYALYDNDGKILLLDLGLSEKAIKKAIGFRVADIVGAVVSHGHLDHAKSVKDFENMGIPVFSHKDTEIDFEGEHEERKRVRYGKLDINAFALTDKNGKFMHTNNDGSECPCYGFLIEHEDMGKLLYITDTELVKWRFKDINHIILGVNYCNELLCDETAKRNHVLRGHMSIETACNFIESNDNPNLRNVVLCHLSYENSDEKMFEKKIRKVTRASCFIAKPKLEVSLDLFPF